MNPFDEYDSELMAKAKAEIAKEDAAWAKLPEAEKLRILQEREAKANALFDAMYNQDEEECCDECGEQLDYCICDDEDEE